jgi:uncharacterized membrane protein
MTFNWKRELPSILMLAAMFAMAVWSWPTAPERIPVHWDTSGQPDRYGGKLEGLLFLPFVALGLYVLLLVLPRIDPRRAHYAQFSGPYALLRTALTAFLLAVSVMVQSWIHGRPIDTNAFMGMTVGGLVLVLGAALPGFKSNWFVGVRTPWTLSSEASWARTHRLAGRLFIACGVIILAASLVRPTAAVPAILGTLLPAAAASIVFSYFAWRSDPARGGADREAARRVSSRD